MREQEKIDEAVHFRARMAQTEADPQAFRHELSAFLAAAGSVLLYAKEEVLSKKPAGPTWLEARVTNSPILKFFRAKRNRSIHVEPVVPMRTIEVTIEERLTLTDSISWTLIGPDGTVKEQGGSPPTVPPPTPPPNPATVTYRYTFTDWTGPEEVPILCDRLLAELRDVVSDGRTRGLLT